MVVQIETTGVRREGSLLARLFLSSVLSLSLRIFAWKDETSVYRFKITMQYGICEVEKMV